jgi:type IV pilus assembly protein PilQ
LKNVDYADRAESARVVLEAEAPVVPVLVAASDKQVIFELPGVEIPRQLQRALDVRGYQGPVTTVSTFTGANGRARVVVDLARAAKPVIARDGNRLYLDFARPTVAAREQPISYSSPVTGGYGVATTPVTAQSVAQRASVSSQRIDIDVVDTDIHNLMRLMAQAGNIDIVVPDDVRANVTVRLSRVPWRQAMEVILQSKGLWYKQEGRIVRVATRKDLDAEEQAERERLRARIQEERPETIVFTLNYATASEVQSQVNPLLSPRGKSVIDSRTNSIVLTDVAGNRNGITALLRRLDTQTPQIQIEARVVEARTTWRRQLGIQWGFGGIASAATGNPTGLVFPNTIGIAGGNDAAGSPLGGLFTASPNFAVNMPAATGLGAGGAIGFTFASVSNNFNVALRLSAAEDTGTVRIISAPKITVLNNRPATISQGVSIPISVVSAAGAATQFVPADLSLRATPHVSQRDCSIQLDLNVTKNEADFVNTGARGDPTILRKEATTTMLIADGETSVIGGIYTRNSGLSHAKVPWLADIPIIGYLFKNTRENDERTEVLIFLTPRITNKASLHCETAADRAR